MPLKITNSNNYEAIAAAIRAKNGSADTYLPSEMAPAIMAIPSGGGNYSTASVLIITGINTNMTATEINAASQVSLQFGTPYYL